MRPFHTPALQVEETQALEHGLHAAEPAEAVHIGHLLRSHHEVAADVLGEVPVGKHVAVLLLRHAVVFVDGLLGDVLDVAGVEVGGAVLFGEIVYLEVPVVAQVLCAQVNLTGQDIGLGTLEQQLVGGEGAQDDVGITDAGNLVAVLKLLEDLR